MSIYLQKEGSRRATFVRGSWWCIVRLPSQAPGSYGRYPAYLRAPLTVKIPLIAEDIFSDNSAGAIYINPFSMKRHVTELSGTMTRFERAGITLPDAQGGLRVSRN